MLAGHYTDGLLVSRSKCSGSTIDGLHFMATYTWLGHFLHGGSGWSRPRWCGARSTGPRAEIAQGRELTRSIALDRGIMYRIVIGRIEVGTNHEKGYVVVGIYWCGGMLHGNIVRKMVLRERRRFCCQRGRVLMSSRPIGVISISRTLVLTRRAGSVWGDVVWRPCHRDMITVTGKCWTSK